MWGDIKSAFWLFSAPVLGVQLCPLSCLASGSHQGWAPEQQLPSLHVLVEGREKRRDIKSLKDKCWQKGERRQSPAGHADIQATLPRCSLRSVWNHLGFRTPQGWGHPQTKPGDGDVGLHLPPRVGEKCQGWGCCVGSQPCEGLMKKNNNSNNESTAKKPPNPKSLLFLSPPPSRPCFFPGVVYGHRRELKSRHGRIGLISDPEPLKLCFSSQLVPVMSRIWHLLDIYFEFQRTRDLG